MQAQEYGTAGGPVAAAVYIETVPARVGAVLHVA